MSTQTERLQESRKFTVPLSAEFTDQGPQLKLASNALALAGVLQTTLEINQLMALFFAELGRIVTFDGLHYDFPASAVDIRLGTLDGHCCSYELEITDEDLGSVQFFRAYRFKERELETIENMLIGLLYPLRNTLLYQQALQSAVIDPLTGVKNRAAMDSALQREVGLAQRHNNPLSIIIFDIDHFKQINDLYGHLSGDHALRQIAQSAQQTIRDSDLIFRYGGEEFLIILTNTNLAGAKHLAERIRVAVEQITPIAETDDHYTISLGVASLLETETPDELFQRTDKALYEAKQSGRNRVASA